MIKKRDCYDFLDIYMNKAVDSIEEKFNDHIKTLESDLVLAYKPQINEIQKLTNELQSKALKLEDNLRQDKNIGFSKYNTLASETSSYTGTNEIFRQIIFNSDFGMGDVQKLKDRREKAVHAVKDEYSKVAMIVKNKANGQQAAEYLKGIGFDIALLEKAENNQLMTISINKNLLFVKEDE